MRGEYVAPTLGRVTVGELGPAWLERQRGHMKPPVSGATKALADAMSSRAGAMSAISDVRYTDVEAWVAELSAGAAR